MCRASVCVCVCMGGCGCAYVCVYIYIYIYIYPTNKEPFLNQLACVIVVHNWYRSTSTCFHVNTHVLPIVMSFERV